MKRIILHWTAGSYMPNAHDLECYHFLIDSKGCIHNGKFSPENNLVCKKGCYAAHTGGGNTGSIGVSFCGMFGFKNKNETGKYPITPKQFEAGMKLCAELCIKYKLEITPQTVMTHYEFGKINPHTTSAGKIDITYIPPYPWVDKNDAGSFIRTKSKWYRNQIQEKK